jgi:hypothetical protein
MRPHTSVDKSQRFQLIFADFYTKLYRPTLDALGTLAGFLSPMDELTDVVGCRKSIDDSDRG